MSATLVGISIFADGNIVKISTRDYPGLSRWVLSQLTSVLVRTEEGEDTDTEKNPCDGEAETEGVQPPAKEHKGGWQPPEVRGEAWELPEGTNLADTLISDFEPLEL